MRASCNARHSSLMGRPTRGSHNSKMLPKDLVAFIEEGVVEKMAISRPSSTVAWTVYAYGQALPADAINRIELNLEGSQRLWADLDAAYSFIRKSGFRDQVLIEG